MSLLIERLVPQTDDKKDLVGSSPIDSFEPRSVFYKKGWWVNTGSTNHSDNQSWFP